MKKWWCTLMEEMKRQNWGSDANVTILWSRHKMSLNRHHSVLVSRKSVFSLSSVQPCMFSAINSIGFCFPFSTTKKMRSCAKKLQPYACFSPASFGCCCARDSLLYSKMHLIFLMMRSKCHNITLSLTVWVCRFAVGFHITITNLYFVVFAYILCRLDCRCSVCAPFHFIHCSQQQVEMARNRNPSAIAQKVMFGIVRINQEDTKRMRKKEQQTQMGKSTKNIYLFL